MIVFIVSVVTCVVFASAVVYELRRLEELLSITIKECMGMQERAIQSSKNITQMGLILQSILQLLDEEQLKQVDENYKKNLKEHELSNSPKD